MRTQVMQRLKCVEGNFGLLLTNAKASVTPASSSQIRRGPGHNAIALRRPEQIVRGLIRFWRM